jgi:hypothetical protein
MRLGFSIKLLLPTGNYLLTIEHDRTHHSDIMLSARLRLLNHHAHPLRPGVAECDTGAGQPISFSACDQVDDVRDHHLLPAGLHMPGILLREDHWQCGKFSSIRDGE